MCQKFYKGILDQYFCFSKIQRKSTLKLFSDWVHGWVDLRAQVSQNQCLMNLWRHKNFWQSDLGSIVCSPTNLSEFRSKHNEAVFVHCSDVEKKTKELIGFVFLELDKLDKLITHSDNWRNEIFVVSTFDIIGPEWRTG